jgi:hypothetical protein
MGTVWLSKIVSDGGALVCRVEALGVTPGLLPPPSSSAMGYLPGEDEHAS